MGQKINPLVFKLNHTNNWKSKYFEKKSTEHSIVSFKDIEIRDFTKRFFEYNGLLIHDLKISYYNNTIIIFVSYFSTLKSVSLISYNNKTKKPNKQLIKQIKKLNRKKNTLKNINKKNINKRNINKRNKNIYKLRRVQTLQNYNNLLDSLTNKTKIVKLENNSFLNKFSEVLSSFFDAKCNVSLVLNRINNNIKQKTTKNKSRILKKKLVKLQKYKQNFFFKEGLNVLFLATNKKNSANILSYFIANQLQKLKRHNFFIRFLKNSLISFYNNKFLNGIKIKIKGRFNGAPRSRHRLIIIGNGVPMLTINNNLDYGESVAFTSNGTFGVKVWISQKN